MELPTGAITPIKTTIEKAAQFLKNVGVKPEESDTRAVELLQEVVHVDEPKVVATADAIRYMGAWNRHIDSLVKEIRVDDRHEKIAQYFGSIVTDMEHMKEHRKDDKFTLQERAHEFWIEFYRGTPHSRFGEIKELYLAVAGDTKKRITIMKETLDTYLDYREAVKKAEVMLAQVYEKQQKILNKATADLKKAQTTLDNYKGDSASRRAELEGKRDEALRNQKRQDNNYQLLKDCVEFIKKGYEIGKGLIDLLDHWNNINEALYRRATISFVTNQQGLVTLDLNVAVLSGTREQTRALEAYNEGERRLIEAVADAAKDLQKDAIEAAYGPKGTYDAAKKLFDTLIALRDEHTQLIAEQRKLATEETQRIHGLFEEYNKKSVEATTRYVQSREVINQKALPPIN